MKLTIRLVHLGWIEATIQHHEDSLGITASYIGDAPRELLEAVEQLQTGAATARCRWLEEPGEYRWIFERTGALVDVRILWFDDGWHDSDDAGVMRFESTVSLSELAFSVTDGMSRMVSESGGPEGYFRKWTMAFPENVLGSVQSRLRAPEQR
ncbi:MULTISPECIES: hypothetical protein [unclassified Leifsonia]|uniref:hypothetical protein n=1 Tax=unclassified Leifsonia TaxID=2663824 RepID=UPI0006FFC4B8|nr:MULTISPECIES: hypothetical protein [unclassified Leifsonia]KQX07758.1 hypothetical protein ASC59_08505 [Leifsonia sp. Root1293]KRA12040.1 hypothetical protein ASD61_08505 [Leifsonia sp. Root60]